MSGRVILCDCGGSQRVDEDGIGTGTGLACSRVHSALCTHPEDAARELAQGGIMACGQEVDALTEVALAAGVEVPAFVDIRDRAGWTDDRGAVGPKQAALLADAATIVSPARALDVGSEGLCLVIGPPTTAVAAAERLCGTLSITVLLPDGSPPPDDRRFEAVSGRIRAATGAFGSFALSIDGLRQVDPTGRGPLEFGPPRDGGRTECDVILDLSGGTPLFPAHHKRDGYLRPDPKDPQAVADAILEASQMVGTFEKPLYVRTEPALCAHSRAGQVGCTNCLDICPTGAISPAGDFVEVDPMVCAGCGACSSLCPSGAIAYDAPAPADLFRRIDAMARAFRAAGGADPALLVHDGHGAEMIRLSARYGRGLPAHVVPMEVPALTAFGHAEQLAALGAGFARVDVVLAPRTERPPLEREATLTAALGGMVRLLDHADPDALSDDLFATGATASVAAPILPLGTRRQVARTAARAIAGEAVLPLPAGAPYGAVLVDRDACTLCLSCVSLCPSGALADNPDRPELRFQEDACLQCGICETICPEDAIALEPRFDLTPAALEQRVLNEEEPAECISCGAPFGVASTIERVAAQLAGRHSAFGGSAADLIRMCDRCRIEAQAHSENSPFAMGERPRTRTTEDYYSDRKDH